MGRVLRGGLVVVGVVLLVAVLAAGGLVAALTASAQPPLSGSISAPGLGDKVEISRDASGVTHVTASTTHDLFFGQGWLHASERLWQMEVYRRIGSGRLAEVFGEGQVDTDAFIRTLGWRQAAERDLAGLSDEAHAILQAYADGVNAFVDGHPNALGPAWVVGGLLAGAGTGLTGLRPEPWTPLDTVTFAKVQAWSLGGNLDTEIFRLLADARLGDPALTDALFPAYGDDRPVIADPSDGGGPGLAATDSSATAAGASTGRSPAPTVRADAAAWVHLARIASGIPALAGLAPERDLVGDGGIGSNNWVVGPEHSRTGGALLANDPHLAFSMPSIWYVNGLHCRPVGEACPWDVAGVSFPGTPLVIAGHNARIAWGVTNVNPDVQDLVEERVDPDDPARYLTEDGSEPFIVRTETIRVAGDDDITLDVRETRHGPIITDADPRLADSGVPYALRWTALARQDGVLDAFLGINRATDFASFREALRSYGAPSQNFVYADVDGHIGYQMPGAVPVRTLPEDVGARPVRGWDGEHEWVAYVPFDELPTVFDPPSGRIATANNKVASETAFLGDEWDPGHRAARILELLDAAGDDIDLDTLASIQGDTLLRRAARLMDGVAAADPAPATADGEAVLDRIGRWDGACTTDSSGCAAYVVFEHALVRALVDDELGALARDYAGADAATELVAALLATPEGRVSPWWGDARAGQPGDARTVVAGALDTAGAWLRRDLGDPRAWTWGRIHTITFRETTLGSSGVAPLEWYFDSPTYPVDGADGAVDNTYYRLSRAYPDPDDPEFEPADTLPELFAVTNGPSMRALYDLSDLDAARIVTTTGQSGHPFSRHADDWVPLWLANETVPLPFSQEARADASVAVLELVPQP